MATIKAYTDLSQSKTLSKILPLESADMCYLKREINDTYIETPIIKPEGEVFKSLPCWSLAALLGVLPKYELNNFGDTIQLDVNLEALATEGDETLLDLVVNMIIKLNELNLL